MLPCYPTTSAASKNQLAIRTCVHLFIYSVFALCGFCEIVIACLHRDEPSLTGSRVSLPLWLLVDGLVSVIFCGLFIIVFFVVRHDYTMPMNALWFYLFGFEWCWFIVGIASFNDSSSLSFAVNVLFVFVIILHLFVLVLRFGLLLSDLCISLTQWLYQELLSPPRVVVVASSPTRGVVELQQPLTDNQ